jgi:putative membrane protein insertion efficiency factor
METIKNTTMNYKFIFLAIICSVVLFSPVASQNKAKHASKNEQLHEVFAQKEVEKPKHNHYLKKSSNELEATVALTYTVYKKYISSQDMGSCVFHPSCSTYAIEALQTDNPFVAYVKIFDRLSRCHGFSKPGQYPQHKNTGLLYDPVH